MRRGKKRKAHFPIIQADYESHALSIPLLRSTESVEDLGHVSLEAVGGVKVKVHAQQQVEEAEDGEGEHGQQAAHAQLEPRQSADRQQYCIFTRSLLGL